MMHQRSLVIADLTAVSVALAITVPMMIVAMLGSHDLKFEYVKSDGIAGIYERLEFDSKNNIITFCQRTLDSIGQRELSDAKVL
jgi:hypothetical protein